MPREGHPVLIVSFEAGGEFRQADIYWPWNPQLTGGSNAISICAKSVGAVDDAIIAYGPDNRGNRGAVFLEDKRKLAAEKSER